jgi:hypothetical protein
MFRAVFAFLLAFITAAQAADCPRPVPLRFEVTGKIVRSEVGFTQGLEWHDGKLYESTGAIGDHSGLNTIATDGKVTRLREWLSAQRIDWHDCDTTFYSDSINDLPLLNAVRNPVAVNPDMRLAAEAAERGWPVLTLRSLIDD